MIHYTYYTYDKQGHNNFLFLMQVLSDLGDSTVWHHMTIGNYIVRVSTQSGRHYTPISVYRLSQSFQELINTHGWVISD